MQPQSDHRNHHHSPVIPRVVNKIDEELKYQRAAGILRKFHSTHCCPPLNVIHEDPDDNDDDDDDSHNPKLQSERHLFKLSGLISRSTTVACLAALALQEGSTFRNNEQGRESPSGSGSVESATSNEEDVWGYYNTASDAMLSERKILSSNRRVKTKPSSFSSRRHQSSPLSRVTTHE
jgi:hypothetical protein